MNWCSRLLKMTKDAGLHFSAKPPFMHEPLSRAKVATASDVLPCSYHVTHEGNAMSETTFTFRVDETLKSEFSTAAKNRDRNAAQLLRDFMRDFVRQQQEAAEHDAWFRRQVQIGLDSANAGNLIPSAEVEAKFAAKRAATRSRLEAAAE
jgi:predicted transcriptional regulator